MNKKGFTIAEIFIALIIVGILMVMLAPVVQRSSPNQDKIMFRKAYNSLSQAISNMSFDDKNYPDTTTTADTGQTVYQGFNNQLNYATAGVKFCTLLADQLNTIGDASCGQTLSCGGQSNGGWGSFTTSDGIVWRTYEGADGTVCKRTCTNVGSRTDCSTSFPVNMTTHQYQSKIIVDVDGPNRGPNCSTDSNATSFGLSRCPTYNNCNPNANPTIPAGTTIADLYIIGVRFDGGLHLGSSDDGTETDTCGSIILSESTTNTQQ